MRYGFVIDQDRCIGCHACTVACKEEHQVPVGVFRTWVKHIEKGEFPHSSRHFGVMRCNHCDDSPCTEICPTSALYRRSDGIVDFDNRRCIGCKACMQACPYDALYIDPNNNTAAKCNFCAHRVEMRLEPACVIVCPTQAILAGDLDHPGSKVSRIVASKKVSVRKPQKGTQPKLFYVGIEGDLLEPTRISRKDTYFASDRGDGNSQVDANDGSNLAGALAREVYDVPHPAPWGWKIAAYLWTKAIAAGVLLVAAILLSFAGASAGPLFNIVCPAIALAGLGMTSALLVFDLKRPDRFFYLITKPNFRSWLVIGTYFLIGYGALATAWLLCGIFASSVPSALQWFAAAFAIASACYSAFLFAQAKGRDLWQSPLFLWHLLMQALAAGSATILIVGIIVDAGSEVLRPAALVLLISLIVSLAMNVSEIALPHVSEDVRIATQVLLNGRLSGRFWGLVIGAGLIAPIILTALGLASLIPGGAAFAVVAAVLALAGLWWFEELWVKAGQAAPLS
ncbi:MAG TPA: NrfD/PsrC family molybdoenzyme membrane anchor subunit [Terriglobales bacterium]|nr:NrfD/PsrC family molybdoenzyme membrane anchor subunit [Terriglobales bacterium]